MTDIYKNENGTEPEENGFVKDTAENGETLGGNTAEFDRINTPEEQISSEAPQAELFEQRTASAEPQSASYERQNAPSWNGTEYSYRPAQQPYTPNPNQSYSQSYTGASDGSRGYSENAQGNFGTAQGYTPNFAQGPRGGYTSPKLSKKKKSAGMSKGAVALLLIVCILLSGAAGFGGAVLATRTGILPNISSSASGSNSVIYQTTPSNQNLGDTNYSVANVTEAVADSVVEIVTEKVTTSSIFGQYVEGGAGSGVIITSDGYIITCAHVIDGATTVTVTLTDGTDHVATVIGSDAQTDVALLKIDATGLTSATVGSSDSLIVGEPVIAIGNPLGELGGTVTSGIISALEREVTIDGTTYTLLQTDAAVNSGNSGGALFNINGELIGIVNAKQSGSGIEGLGFAIPIDGAIEIVNQLRENGYVKGRPMLGVSLYDISDESALYNLRGSDASALLNYVTGYGVYFVQYAEGQSGDLAFGDRIVAIDGVSISGLSDIKELLAEHSVGDTLTVTVSRVTNQKNGRATIIDIPITLIESGSVEQN